MKNANRNQSDRLAELLGDIDPALLAEAIRTDTPEALAAMSGQRVPVAPQKPRVWTKGRIHALVASAAVVVALALVLPVALRLADGLPIGPGGSENPWETTEPDPYVDPESVIPPWVSGALKLTSLTYGEKTNTAAIPYPTLSLLMNTTEETETLTETEGEHESENDTVADTEDASDAENGTAADAEGMTDAEGETETDTETGIYGKGENVTVSFMDNVKITSYMGSDLIKLRPESGEHMTCPDVYYDIRLDDYFCMSCHVSSLMEGREDYTDAAIRCFIEECIVSFAPLWTSGWEIEEYRAQVYALLTASEARALFANRESITVNKLGEIELLSDEHRDHVKEAAREFKYPVVDIAEYGQDMERCLFTLVSPRTGLAYGNYICDLTGGEILRIDKNCTGYDIPNLASAYVLITENYTKVVAAVPDFPRELTTILHTGLWKPIYTGHNICIFSAQTGECERLITEETAANAPRSGVTEHNGFMSYTGMDGQIYVFGNGEFYPLTGALTRVVKDTDGNCYAVVRNGEEGYILYRLAGKKALPVEVSQLEGKLDVANRYAVEGNIRRDLLTGETLILWEGTPTSSAVTGDGRYIYLYFRGEAAVLCLDVWTNERGYLSLSDSFLEAADQGAEITYNLILNAGEDRLLMTYFKEGQITFDAAAFRENVGMAGGNVTKAIVEVTDYFLINGERLRFYETEKAHDLLRLLSVSSILDTVVADGMSRDANIALSIQAAEALIPYLEVWSRTAEVPDGIVESMLGDMTLTMFRELYQYKLKAYGRQYKLIQLDNAFGASRREYALTGMTQAVSANYFAFLGLEVDSEVQNALSPAVYAAMDTVLDEERMFSEYDFVEAYTSLICEITEQLTGQAYDAYITSGGFLDAAEAGTDNAYYFVTNSNTAGDIRCGLNLPCDTAYIRQFLSGLVFTEGDKDIRVEGRLTRRFTVKYNLDGDMALLEVGYASDGQAYAVIDGYYAEITPEDVESFKTLSVDRNSSIAYYPNNHHWG